MRRIGTLVAAAIVAAGCVRSKATTVAPTVFDLAQVNGVADPDHSCSPRSAPVPDPVAWWSAQPSANKPLAAVGFQIWRNLANHGACTEHKEIAYRSIIEFDLTAIAALRTAVAESLTFITKVIPAGATPDASNRCDAHSGGLGALYEVMPTQRFHSGMSLWPIPFPSALKLVSFPLPWTAGPIDPGATTAAAEGGARFTVDVTSRVQSALTSHQSTVQFMLSGTDEAFPRPVAPPASVDCLTLIEVQPLAVTYLGP